MHAKGYFYEVCQKVMSPGGMMHIIREVLNRKKIIDESFGKKKFQEQNLGRIEEALRDVSFGIGIAAAVEFEKSTSFPDQFKITNCKRATGYHNDVLLSRFKEWITASKKDAYFEYYSQMFTLFGPLQELYLSAIKYGNGIAREAVWMLLYPLFAQSNKRNYAIEALVLILNCTVIWPLSTRELLRKNCSVSLNGRMGHNIALDEWVEMCIVQPMKNYSSGHTTVKMLQRLVANIDIFGATRRCFQSKEAFNVRTASKHHEQDPFPDQVKVAHFVMMQKFVTPDVSRDKVSKFGDAKKTVPVSNINAYEAGTKKVIDTFESKKFSLFGVIAETDGSDHEINNSDSD